ncbi:nucleotidyltransferase domain-containing protein [Cetobacterium sp. 2A]|uniref:nucleotidyltransferase domain-containing protein n=1 Tax=Cetobacterium sp. 2A TaxID=2754723 RepID=UPI00163D212F|nr:nucleotidyltransferase domain-containing protein [Cetobacterium sp. 2A]MBC2855396.1 nucleotidyltransferase domain-containing protein [Cetobacterium sp. 2A]
MINLKEIEEVKNRLVAEFHPKKIYIFGSYAWGVPNEDSDLDIMVILDKYNNKMSEIRRGLKALRGIRFPKDVIINNELEFIENSKKNYTIESEILENGYLLYEDK